MNSKLFTVIIPTYNRVEAVLRLIELIRQQHFTKWELIIVDDSMKSIHHLIERYDDNRILYHYRGIKSGVSLARNEGAKVASGRYLVFLDDDDKVTENWLADFAKLADENQLPDLLLCGMTIINSLINKNKIYVPSDSDNRWRFIFPGSWAIDKLFFNQLGGYDERLHFGENTELFFRIRATNPSMAMTDSVNFSYYPSVDGGSKNIRNRINSTCIVLDKHKDMISQNKNLERVLTQVIGVCYLRLHNFSEAKQYLWRAYILNPFKGKAFLRLIIAYMPFLSRHIYTDKSIS